MKWHTAAGGTSGFEGSRSYTSFGPFGEYHIWPPERRGGGYTLLWADTRSLKGRGLWSTIGNSYRSPAQAKSAARKHAWAMRELWDEKPRRQYPRSTIPAR